MVGHQLDDDFKPLKKGNGWKSPFLCLRFQVVHPFISGDCGMMANITERINRFLVIFLVGIPKKGIRHHHQSDHLLGYGLCLFTAKDPKILCSLVYTWGDLRNKIIQVRKNAARNFTRKNTNPQKCFSTYLSEGKRWPSVL